MKTLLAILAFAASVVFHAVAEPIPVRNPFWPIGYEGERAVITAEPRVKVTAPAVSKSGDDDTKTAAEVASVAAAAATAVAAKAEDAMTQHWIAARKTLEVGSPLVVNDGAGFRRSSVMINGKAYADGDFVSITHSGRRFTWKVVGLNDSDVLKLIRVRVRKIEEPVEELEKGKNK